MIFLHGLKSHWKSNPLGICTMRLSITFIIIFTIRIVQSFEAITLNLAASSDSFSLSEEEVSVKSEMVSMHAH